ncbi:methionine-tRNA ligase [Aphanomyces invadans]|uniref:methionine--tRNA ligase n=1 Tax=Aphanomyces invadans TaxID=157072 RepID=A0A024UGJ0_9STRA|nr:methionine-tRNA ligase [Aphanomyces invadans]ETW05320.1 methionine-tRNA ligase [Aphanomyces invadans]|eukprot:XP_008866758.1 methionine-tRNA ligase [Aphanomyces invadans]
MDALKDKVAALDVSDVKLNGVTPASNEKFYITTAIHYTNGQPHMGHAYENVTSDVIARYHRTYGRDVFFLTGTDEHGQKIAQTAETQGISPIELCDKYSGIFQQLAKDLNMSNDHFIRTTSKQHKEFAQLIFAKAEANGDIYKGTYEGWYNVREETFVTENEAALINYKDPTTGTPLKKMQESSYFFRMSKYQERLIAHYHAHPEFLQPENHRQIILKRLEEPLLDLSASRTTFSHGVPLPNDPAHVMYVWFDALSNYLSGIDYPNGALAKYWPASVHIIGKDITWFHCVIWPCILMSAGFPLPTRVFAHGFVNARDGTKMSKSIGNVVDPYDMIQKYGVDSFRYFLVRGAKYGSDMPFSEDEFFNIHNAELNDTLGNLVHRGLTLSVKYTNGHVPDVAATPCFDVAALKAATEEAFQAYALQEAAFRFMEVVRATNGYLTTAAPWHMTDDHEKKVVVRTILEAIYVFAHYMVPFMPATAARVFEFLHTAPTTLPLLSNDFNNLTPGTPIKEVTKDDILFEKLKSEAELAALASKQAAAAAPPVVKKAKEDLPLFASCDIRVGTIVKAWHHPDSDKLFCEEIDVGFETGPVQIASGLRPFYSLDDMTGRRCLVLLNIKAAKLAGFKSNGMVLCASNEAHDVVEFIEPPAGAANGERVFIATESGDPVSEGQMKKQKIWEKLSVDLQTNDKREGTYKGHVIQTSAGPVVSKTLTNARIG